VANDSFLIMLSFCLIFMLKLRMKFLIPIYFLIILNVKVAPFGIGSLHLLSEVAPVIYQAQLVTK